MAGGGSSKGSSKGVHIVVAGDRGTGKSSLIVTAAADTFLTNVPPVLPPTSLPDDMYPEIVHITILDTSSRKNNWKLEVNLNSSRVVVVRSFQLAFSLRNISLIEEAAAGTICYIDPEYQQTGMLGTKSDLYSLGVMLLQLITVKPPIGITHQVSRAIEKGTLLEVFDPRVPDWPVEEATSFAKLCLQCRELRRKDMPDLDKVILPELNRLRELGYDDETNFT